MVTMTTWSHTYIIAMKILIVDKAILNMNDIFVFKICRLGYKNYTCERNPIWLQLKPISNNQSLQFLKDNLVFKVFSICAFTRIMVSSWNWQFESTNINFDYACTQFLVSKWSCFCKLKTLKACSCSIL
jgi:hypothetical protein